MKVVLADVKHAKKKVKCKKNIILFGIDTRIPLFLFEIQSNSHFED